MNDYEDGAKSEYEANEMEKYEESGSEDSFEIWKVKKYIDERIFQLIFQLIIYFVIGFVTFWYLNK